MQVWYASYGRTLLAIPGQLEAGNARMYALDECGRLRWKLPKLASYKVMVGLDDSILITTPLVSGSPPESKYSSYLYSRDGKKLGLFRRICGLTA